MANDPTPNVTPLRDKGLIVGLIKGNQCLRSPDHKVLIISGGRGTWPGAGWLISHKTNMSTPDGVKLSRR